MRGMRAQVVGEGGKVDEDQAVALLSDLGRATTVLRRISEIDERLDRRGAGNPPPADTDETEEETARLADDAEARFTLLRGGKG